MAITPRCTPASSHEVVSSADQVGWALRPFGSSFASELSGWVIGEEQLRWLAPGTHAPLTPAKVLNWKRELGHPLLLFANDQQRPIGYGELNAMPKDLRSLWLGHVIIRPDCRGLGYGRLLTEALLDLAFNEMRCKCVSLIVFPQNVAAVKCYLRAGFCTVGDEYHRFCGREQKYRLLRLQIEASQRK